MIFHNPLYIGFIYAVSSSISPKRFLNSNSSIFFPSYIPDIFTFSGLNPPRPIPLLTPYLNALYLLTNVGPGTKNPANLFESAASKVLNESTIEAFSVNPLVIDVINS